MIEPVIKTIRVPASPEEAFRRFTDEVGTWWPKTTHSVSQDKCKEVAWSGPAGSDLYEIDEDGNRHVWGAFKVWEPPKRAVFSWHPSRGPETAQEIELTFTVDGDETEVRLEHRHFDQLGEDAAKTRENYNNGWLAVLEMFADSVR